MKKSELRQMIREEFLKEGPKWVTNNIDKDMYNLWASMNLVASNISHYMDDMNSGKEADAYFSLDIALDEWPSLLKYMKKYYPQLQKELKSKGK